MSAEELHATRQDKWQKVFQQGMYRLLGNFRPSCAFRIIDVFSWKCISWAWHGNHAYIVTALLNDNIFCELLLAGMMSSQL